MLNKDKFLEQNTIRAKALFFHNDYETTAQRQGIACKLSTARQLFFITLQQSIPIIPVPVPKTPAITP